MIDKSFLVTDEGFKLYPVSDNIIFKFCANLTKSTFQPISKGGIIISDKDDYDEHTFYQWGEIIALGPDVCDDIRNSKYILIEPHRWTHKVRLNGPYGEYLWKTETQYIIAMSDEYHNPYSY
jgi:co-chaperonin GroES (HSP10)